MKRFTETEKWKDPWFRGLKGSHKLLFVYLIENCNNAGFYEMDLEMMEFQTGLTKEAIEGALKGLERAIKGASGWLWIRTFLRHQKNEVLNESNPAHKQIILLLKEQAVRFAEIPEFVQFVAPYKGLLSPIGKGIGKGKKGSGEGKRTREEFETFYAAYPKKQSREKALAAWLKRSDIPENVMELLETQKRSEDWKKEGGKYVPQPSTWINQGKWADELETPSGNPIPSKPSRLDRSKIEEADFLKWVSDNYSHPESKLWTLANAQEDLLLAFLEESNG